MKTQTIKWGNRTWKEYKPQVNRKRQSALILAFIPFLLTVGTNWLYFIGIKVLFKLNPLFLYK